MKSILFIIWMISMASCSYAEQVRPRVDVLHIWRTVQERHALNVFRNVLIENGVSWTDAATKIRRINIQDTLAHMASVGASPGAFQLDSSSTSIEKLYESGLLRPIENIKAGYLETIIPELRQSIYIDKNILVLPVGIHTYNFMIYNKSLMQKYGFEEAESWEEFLSYAEVLKADGISLIASSDQFWQLRTLTRAVLSSYFTRDELLELVNTGDDTQLDKFAPALEKAYSVIARLKEYSLHNTANLPWDEAAARVRENKALAQILGDYIIPLYPDKENYLCAITPRSNFISWGFDSFGLSNTTDPETSAGQAQFVKVASDVPLLKEYLRRKSGLPVLLESDENDLDDCNRLNFTAWRSLPTLDANLLITRHSSTLFMEIAHFWDASPHISPGEAAANTLKILKTLK